MPDIIVTTPKTEIGNAALEAAECIAAGGGYYFRRISTRWHVPKSIKVGDRCWYTENGYLRGFAVIDAIVNCQDNRGWTCETTGRHWGPGVYIRMRADSWAWIKPVPMRSFQGWRYFDGYTHPYQIVGGWRDPKPPDQPSVDNAADMFTSAMNAR